MKKRLISVILIALMLALPMQTMAAYFKPPGPTMVLSTGDFVSSENVKIVSETSFSVGEGGGTLVTDFLHSFTSDSLSISYSAESDLKITGNFGEEEIEILLPADNTLADYDFKSSVTEGDKIANLKFSGAVSIKSITVNQADWVVCNSKPYYLPEFTDEEEAIHSAVILKESSSAILVNGATRYIDNENIAQKPVYIEGNLCLPIHTLARALNYYLEEKPELNYVLFRNEQNEFVVRDGEKYINTNHRMEKGEFPIYNVNGKTFAGVRYFAELIGENVVYDNGTVYIDFRNINQENLENDAVKKYVASLLDPFAPEVKTGNTYYVAQTFNASDNNPGTIDAPFKTLAKASKVAQAGDTVIVRKGIYREILTPENDGTAKSPITFKAAEGEEVIISATEEITEFIPYGNDGWLAAPFPYDLGRGNNQIFYNNDCIIEARYPNDPAIDMGEGAEPLHALFPVRGDFYVHDEDKTILTSPSGLLDQDEENLWEGAIYVGAYGYAWTLTPSIVKASKKGEITLGDHANRYNYDPKSQNLYDWGYLTGTESCMDLPGEWVVKSGTLIIIPPEGEDASTLKLEAKARHLVANLNERKYVRLEGFKTLGGSVTMNFSEMCMLNGMNLNYISHALFNDDAREGYIVRDSAIKKTTEEGSPHRGEVGIHISGKNNVVINSDINYSAYAGLFLTGLYTYVENNILNSCGYIGSYVSGITAGSDPLYSKSAQTPRGGYGIYGNTVYRCGRSAYNAYTTEGGVSWSTPGNFVPNQVSYNDFHDAILFSLDTGITYEYGTRFSTDRVYSKMNNNYIYYTVPETNPYSFGLYHDGNSEGTDTYENIVFTTREGVKFTSAYVYRNTAMSPNIMWNNSEIKNTYVEGGPENLELNQYPNNQPFYAGADRFSKDFMKNYNKMEENFVRLTYEDAEIPENAFVTDEKSIAFNDTEAIAVFKDVDFTEEGKNNVNVYFKGDRFANPTQLEIGFGESYETAKFSTALLTATGENSSKLNVSQVDIDGAKGVTNVFLRLASRPDEKISVDSLVFDNYGKGRQPHDGAMVYAGNFDRIDRIGDTTLPPKAQYGGGREITPYVNQVWTGSSIRYKDVPMPKDAKVFFYNVGTGTSYADQEIIFSYNQVGDPQPIEFARVRTTPNGWDTDNDTKYVELPAALKGDVVDIYITFGATSKGKATTCNLYTFGFIDKIPEE